MNEDLKIVSCFVFMEISSNWYWLLNSEEVELEGIIMKNVFFYIIKLN